MKPGFGKRKKRPYFCGFGRIKTLWISDPTGQFKSDYQLEASLIHYGHFGQFYRVKRKKDKKILAVQIVSKSKFHRLDRSPPRRLSLLMGIQGEIDIMRRIQHKHIVGIFGVYEERHKFYTIFEECKGCNLWQLIKEKGKIEEKTAATILKCGLEALFFLHEFHRVIHCHLSPVNILNVNKLQDSSIKVSGFCYSKVLPRLRHDDVWNSAYYTAPEIVEGYYDHTCDMWSVGMLLS